MSRGINKVILVGNLGADPETRYSAGGSAITTIKIATSDSWTDKQTGQKVEKTEWHRVKFFGRLAEIAGEYLKKGKKVYVEGALRTEKYTDKEGIERYTTDIVANEMQMLDGAGGGERSDSAPRGRSDSGRSDSNQGGEREYAGSGYGNRSGNDRPASRAPERNTAPPPSNDFEDDDIPF